MSSITSLMRNVFPVHFQSFLSIITSAFAFYYCSEIYRKNQQEFLQPQNDKQFSLCSKGHLKIENSKNRLWLCVKTTKTSLKLISVVVTEKQHIVDLQQLTCINVLEDVCFFF